MALLVDMITGAERAGFPLTQLAFEVSMHVTLFPLTGEKENVAFVAPVTGIASTFH
jgi:hypothetical protein